MNVFRRMQAQIQQIVPARPQLLVKVMSLFVWQQLQQRVRSGKNRTVMVGQIGAAHAGIL